LTLQIWNCNGEFKGQDKGFFNLHFEEEQIEGFFFKPVPFGYVAFGRRENGVSVMSSPTLPSFCLGGGVRFFSK
jgi:hypothetical protein